MNTLIRISGNTIIDINSGMIAELSTATGWGEEVFPHLAINYPVTTKGTNYDSRNRLDYISLSCNGAAKLWNYLCDNAYNIYEENERES